MILSSDSDSVYRWLTVLLPNFVVMITETVGDEEVVPEVRIAEAIIVTTNTLM